MGAEYIKLPGLIDAHVHLREPGAIQKEDFNTGTMSAIAGGYTSVIDMPNNPEPTISPDALQKKISLAENRVFCDIGFHYGATARGAEEFEAVKDSVFGLKVYLNHTTGTLLIADRNELQMVFDKWPKKTPIIVHCEGKTLETAISLVKLNHKRLHVAHLSTKEDLETVRAAKESGLAVTCEVTPHHLFLTEKDLLQLGPFGIMKPSLKTESDRLALWQGVETGIIDMIATDHAPHTKEEKMSDKPPFGVPGLETALPLLLTEVARQKLTLDQVVKLTSTNSRKIFNLAETPETFTEVDLMESYFIESANLKTKCGWTLFDGMKVTGKVVRTTLRGEVIFNRESIRGNPKGKIIYPRQ